MITVWILNHYALLGSDRHYNLQFNAKDYNVKLFAASTIHNSNKIE